MIQIRNLVYNGDGGIDCEIDHERLGWIPFTARPDTGDEAVESVWQIVKDSENIAPFVPPSGWKDKAHANVRTARDDLLEAITDPEETQTGRIAWHAKLISSLIVLIGIDKFRAILDDVDLPPTAEAAQNHILSSMEFLAEAKGMTVEQFALSVVDKFFGFSASVWLADETTLRAWDAIDGLPDTAAGFSMLDEIDAQLSAEAQALEGQVKGLAGG